MTHCSLVWPAAFIHCQSYTLTRPAVFNSPLMSTASALAPSAHPSPLAVPVVVPQLSCSAAAVWGLCCEPYQSSGLKNNLYFCLSYCERRHQPWETKAGGSAVGPASGCGLQEPHWPLEASWHKAMEAKTTVSLWQTLGFASSLCNNTDSTEKCYLLIAGTFWSPWKL